MADARHSKDTVVKFDTLVKLGTDDLAPSRIIVRLGTGSPMSVEVTGVDAKDNANEKAVDAADILKRYATWLKHVQTLLLSTKRIATESGLGLKPSGGPSRGETSQIFQKLAMQGAGYTVSYGRIMKEARLQDELSFLSGWVGYIYASFTPDKLFVDKTKGKGKEPIYQSMTGDAEGGCAKVMFKLLEAYETEFPGYISGLQAKGEQDRAVLEKAIHESNQIYVKIFRKFLQANFASTKLKNGFKGWNEYLHVSPFVDACHRLLVSGGNALQMLTSANGLSYNFGVNFVSCLPVNGTDGFAGRLVNMAQAYDSPPIDYKTETVNLDSVRIQGASILPIRGVLCTGVSPVATGAASVAGKQEPATRPYIYPPSALENLGPSIVSINPPEWIQNVLPVAASVQQVGPRTLMASAVSDKVKAVNDKNVADTKTTFDKVVSDWMRMNYIQLALGSCRTTITTNFDLNPQPGSVINVWDWGTGAAMFTGYINSVTHVVEIPSGVEGAVGHASTTIELTHVRAPGFRLPVD